MALLGDLVKVLKEGFFAMVDDLKEVGRLKDTDLSGLRDALIDAYDRSLIAGNPVSKQFAAEERESFIGFSAAALTDPRAFVVELFEKWSGLLNKALAAFNVDAPDGIDTLDLGDVLVAKQALADLSESAQQRVTLVLTAVNTVILTGNAVSALAEVVTMGRLRTIAEAIQSWIWANGLGGLTSMAYQPQIGASILPILNRFYNQRSQAQVPGPGDQVRFQLREVYQPDRRKQLLGDDDLSTFKQFMGELGFSGYHADSYWAAHWVLPSMTQLNEMLHRGVIDTETWRRFVRFNDFDPTAIPWLEETIFSPFTRVDARRMASLGVLSDLELLQAYRDIGFFAPTQPDADGKQRAIMVAVPDFTVHKAQALVVWTKMFNALPTLRARFRRGHLSPDELMAELLLTGITPDKAQLLWETVVTAEREERTAPEKELTRGLVARAWKLREINFPQAIFLLERMGWDTAEAELILRVQSLPDDPLAFANTILGLRLTGIGGGPGPQILEEE